MSISRILEIGKRSLLAYQSAVKTTTDNISNANNEYYKRRRMTFDQLNMGYNALGLNIGDAQRLRQRFAEYQIFSENQFLGKYESTHRLLTQIESIFDENSDAGLSKVMSDFFNSWNDLAKEPESQYARNLVVDKAIVLSDSFQRINGDLQNIKDQIVPEVKLQLKDINQKLQLIQKINQQIRKQPNPDLLDQRDKVVDELSQLMNIRIKEKDNGEINIYSDGVLLVSYDVLNELDSKTVNADGKSQIKIQLKNGGYRINIDNGEIAGLLETYNELIPKYKEQMDALARGISQKVNAIHRQGENLEGTTGIDFFASDIQGISDFRLNEAVKNDPSLIASRKPGDAEGDGGVAQEISDLQFKSIFNEGTSHEYYQSFLTQLGDKIQENEFLTNSQKMILEQLKNQRDAVTGVSMDEEMTKMVQYQQAYDAAAKVISTVDEMMSTVLKMV
ncbi:MAG: flagellar hook-associated protein FlgK [Calditrichaeota bacterium]|nr:flagellar hook-associated protein FlgK [Calditrichota bacterium]